MNGFPLHILSLGAIWFSVYVIIQDGKVAVRPSLRGEFDVGMKVLEVVKGVIQIFWSMRPDHEFVIHVTEPTLGLVDYYIECHLLKVFHEEVVTDR
jgi:hypothetical protein